MRTELERMPEIKPSIGPGEYKTKTEKEQEEKEQYWAKLRALEEIDRYYNVGNSSNARTAWMGVDTDMWN